MRSPIAKVMERSIFRTSGPRKRKVEVKPSDIPTFHYTAHLADVRWLRRAARRKSHG